MPPNPRPSSARQAYKAMIDELVEDTHSDLHDRNVRERGIYYPGEEYAEANALVASLSEEQRRVLVSILLDQRKSAVSQALALLDSADDVVITYRGEPVPFDQCENGPHGDYLARCDGWQWLDDRPAPGA